MKRQRVLSLRCEVELKALVEEALARHCTAKARDTVVAVHFALKLVVVRELLLCQTN